MRPRFTRRRLLVSTAAACVAGSIVTPRALAVTGATDRRLKPFDDLMTTFLRDHKPPGAAVAVTCQGRLVYSRGFGLADREAREPVQPESLSRIASISKPFTSAAVMHLVEKNRVKLDDRVFEVLKLEPLLEKGAQMDPRMSQITVRQCLQHTGGWDRDKSLDPMGAQAAEVVAKAFNVKLPIHPRQIIRYFMGKPLDFDPGTQYVYSNFGYCILGRVIEAIAKHPYHEFVTNQILKPAKVQSMRLGKNLLADRAPGEVKYYDAANRTGRAISGPRVGQDAPLPYGVECIETMDANGGWIASAVDLMRFAVALDDVKKCPFLTEPTIIEMLSPPPGRVGHGPKGKPKESYYACGWDCRPSQTPGKYTKWHGGGLAGSNTLMVCRDDAINWAIIFNSDATKDGKAFTDIIDPLLHEAADAVKEWPEINLFT